MKLRAEELSRINLNINSSGYYREIVSPLYTKGQPLKRFSRSLFFYVKGSLKVFLFKIRRTRTI
jgi:hypothetical protein